MASVTLTAAHHEPALCRTVCPGNATTVQELGPWPAVTMRVREDDARGYLLVLSCLGYRAVEMEGEAS